MEPINSIAVTTVAAATGDQTSDPSSSSTKKRDASGYPKSRKGKEKQTRNPGRRRGTRPEGEEGEEGSAGPKEPRLPKRQCALMLGFCGSGYRGMQFQRIQPGLPERITIEGELFKALIAAGAVSKDNADDPVKVNFARAARTDAGVHAVGNVVSMKMITEVPGVDNMLAHINSKLPAQIRLWDFVRVQNSFNARTLCDGRKYTYFFPSYLLIPPKPGSPLDRTFRTYAASVSSEVQYSNDPFWDIPNAETSSAEEDLVRKRAWRATPAHIERLREIVKKFEKTHNFHNFTVTMNPNDKSNSRYMKKLEITDPAVYGDTEWIAVLLDGQSFMLHQRKMVFALVMISRTGTPAKIIDELYSLTTVQIPKMPALGLLLEYPIFGIYNQKIATANEGLEPSDPKYRPPIDFTNYSAEMSEFKQKFIYDNMRGIEDRKGLFDAWIRSVDAYDGTDFLYLNSQGTIPPEAIIQRGVQRENPFKEQRKFNMTSFAPNDGTKMKATEPDDVQDIDEDEPLSKKEMEEAEG
ncbi:pseudouridine synthase [Dendrothele bispora CBS 962.96]|uniref:tRNA pseudouridine synthase 1 n=1 Tax=Dendrothele bispora (strain CBS 962.96) TaxID=1314807 RepID=A0A4S8MR45_DENBC|nr:pseudouridine synthase [Dendrothele bispora CBS 962.96]